MSPEKLDTDSTFPLQPHGVSWVQTEPQQSPGRVAVPSHIPGMHPQLPQRTREAPRQLLKCPSHEAQLQAQVQSYQSVKNHLKPKQTKAIHEGRQQCLWIRAGVGLRSHGYRNHSGSSQGLAALPSPSTLLAGCWECTPHTRDTPGHNPAWPCSSQQQQQQHGKVLSSWPVPFPDRCRHPAPPHQHEQHQQVKAEWARLNTRVSFKA